MKKNKTEKQNVFSIKGLTIHERDKEGDCLFVLGREFGTTFKWMKQEDIKKIINYLKKQIK